ncbi:MAG: hypothetical protein ABW193_08055 [Luteibacter sp.]
MSQIETVLHTGRTNATGGRDSRADRALYRYSKTTCGNVDVAIGVSVMETSVNLETSL